MTKKALWLVIGLIINLTYLTAQTSTMQLIHNAAGITLDTVDVYVNNVKFNNLRFRTSSPRLVYAPGTYKININHKSSVDSGNQKLYSKTITLSAGDRLAIMLQGVEDTQSYAANPLGKTIALSLSITKQANVPTNNSVSYTFLNGITDSRKLNALPRNLPQVFESVEYQVYTTSITSLNTSIPSAMNNSPKIFDLTSEDRDTVYGVRQYPTHTAAYINKNIVLVASGFLKPELNNNGPKADLFAIDSAGGPFIRGSYPTATGFQLIHNSPDVLLDTMDVYINNTKYDNMVFRQSLPFLNLPVGTYFINFNDKNSTDSSDLVKYRYVLKLDEGLSYVLLTKGVLNPALYKPNPNNSSTAFSIHKLFVDYRNPTSSSYFGFQMVNGNQDTRYNNMFVDGVSYFPVNFGETNKLAGTILVNGSNKVSLKDDIKSILSTRRLGGSSKLGRLHFIVSSGFYDSSQLNQLGKPLSLLMYDSTGLINELAPEMTNVQIVHNSADVTLDTIDIYFGGVKINDLAFRNATSELTVYEGEYIVSVNRKGSLHAKDQVITNLNVNVASNYNGRSVYMLVGLSQPHLYATNPGGADRSLKFAVVSGVSSGFVYTNGNAVCFFNGITDAWNSYISSTPSSRGISISSIEYGTGTDDERINALPTLLNVSNNTTSNYVVNMQNYQSNSLVFFLSGFHAPQSNQNGAAKGLFMVTREGGPAITFEEGYRAQFIHTSTDPAIGNVDVWVGEKRVATNLASGLITTSLFLASKDSGLTITKAGAANPNTNQLWHDSLAKFTKGLSYYMALNGWLDSTDTPGKLGFKVTRTTFNDIGQSSGLNITLFNSLSDTNALKVELLKNGQTTPTVLFNTIKSGQFSPSYTLLPSATYALREVLNNRINRAFKFVLNSNLAGMQGVLYTIDNKQSTQPSYYIGMLDGSRYELAQLTSNVQFIHASADSAVRVVDVYVNGLKTLDSFAFTKATPLLTVSANAQVTARFVQHGSTDTTSFLNTILSLDSAADYYAVFNGVSIPSQFAPNPNSVSTALNVALDKRLITQGTSGNSKVDLMYFHGVTDAESTNCRAKSQSAFLSYQNPYKTFQQYSPHPLLNSLLYEVYEVGSGKNIYSGTANLTGKGGKAGIAVFSGFKNQNTNPGGDSMRLFLYWPDGTSQQLITSPVTGLTQLQTSEFPVSLYPNPANAATWLQLYVNHRTAITLCLTQMDGSLVKKEIHTIDPGVHTQLIELADLKPGAYVCSITDGEHTVHLKLLVIRE